MHVAFRRINAGPDQTIFTMASRKELKEQRRREREEKERASAQAERRQRKLRLVGGALALLVVAVGGTILALTQGGGDSAADAFKAKPDGLEQRVADAKLTSGSDHFHPTLKLFVGERAISVPEDIGGPGGSMVSPIHRHAGDEQLHVEGVQESSVTLGQFMRIWDVALSATQLGPYRADGRRTVRMWIKDKGAKRFRESREFGQLKLRDGQQVYLAYGTAEQAPIAG